MGIKGFILPSYISLAKYSSFSWQQCTSQAYYFLPLSSLLPFAS
jgi:hypothetical protein